MHCIHRGPDLNGLHQIFKAHTCSNSCLLPRNKLPVATASTCSHGCLHLCCTCLPSSPLTTKTSPWAPSRDACLPQIFPLCYLPDRVPPVSLHKSNLPHIHPSIYSSIHPSHTNRCGRSFFSSDVNVTCDLPTCDLSVTSLRTDPLSAFNWLCNLSPQSLDDYGALSPSPCLGVRKDVP